MIEYKAGKTREEARDLIWELIKRDQYSWKPSSSEELADKIVNKIYDREGAMDSLSHSDMVATFGMWADVWYEKYSEYRLRVIVSSNWDDNEGTSLVYWPGNNWDATEEVSRDDIYPRYDLQRAWDSEGQPVAFAPYHEHERKGDHNA